MSKRPLVYSLATLAVSMSAALCSGQVITTVAGMNIQGYLGDGGPATSASLMNPEGVVVDSAGNLYFADKGNYAVREINTGGTIQDHSGTRISHFWGSSRRWRPGHQRQFQLD